MRYIFLIIAIIGAISAFIAKLVLKKRMSESLGAQATDSDLTALSSWIKVEEAEKRKKQSPSNPV